MNFAQTLRERIPKEIFTDRELKIAFPTRTPNAIRKGIVRSLANQEIVSLKRGIYLFGKRLRKQAPSTFAVANLLYGPSYISLESALAHHGLIPEAVYTVTSVCAIRKKKRFSTPLGDFSYDFVPCDPFFMGVEKLNEASSGCLIANPMKALFDLVYVRKKRYVTYEEVEKDLRLDLEEFQEHRRRFSRKELERLSHSYGRKTVSNFYELTLRELE